jgi:hypothetical protein
MMRSAHLAPQRWRPDCPEPGTALSAHSDLLGHPGCETKLVAGSQRLLAVGSEAVQKVAGHAEARMPAGTRCPDWKANHMQPDDANRPVSRDTISRGDAIRYRDRSRARLRAATAAAGLASVLTAGAVAYTLPGSHTATVADGGSHSGSATASRAKSSTSSSSTSTKSGSSDGLQGTAAPSVSSGTAQVTSGGS